MKINLYSGDLPNNFKPLNTIAVDSETIGLNPQKG